jgi:hypothetical protein
MNNSLVKQQNSIANTIEQVGGVLNAGTSALATKALAEIQGKVYMAKQFPRQMDLVMSKLQASCERQGLAEVAEYEYNRGGSTINGASIKLLEVVAQCYGNIHYTWKELERNPEGHYSKCIADAWDLETNVSSSLEFDVSHYRDTKGGRTLVTAERDLYELIASNASRRVRKCLENVVPRDIVDSARQWCDQTLTSKVDVQVGIDKALSFFKDTYKITLGQVEAYFGMSRQGFTKNTYLKLQKLFTSFKDGVSTPDEVFPPSQLSKQTLIKPTQATPAPIPAPEPKKPQVIKDRQQSLEIDDDGVIKNKEFEGDF